MIMMVNMSNQLLMVVMMVTMSMMATLRDWNRLFIVGTFEYERLFAQSSTMARRSIRLLL